MNKATCLRFAFRFCVRCVCGLLFFVLAAISGAQAAESRPFDQRCEAWNWLAADRAAIAEKFRSAGTPHYKTVPLPDGGTAILIHTTESVGTQPYALLFGLASDKTVLWRDWEPFPVNGGHSPGVASDEEGNILLVWQDIHTKSVRARQFTKTGKVEMTYDVAIWKFHQDPREDELLSHIEVVAWPKRGWVLAYVTSQRCVAQLLDVQGAIYWGHGVVLETRPSDRNRVSLIVDAHDRLFVLWYSFGNREPLRPNRFLGQFLTSEGKPVRPEPIILGEAPVFSWTSPLQRSLSLAPDGRVRADLYRGSVCDSVCQAYDYRALVNVDGQVEIQE